MLFQIRQNMLTILFPILCREFLIAIIAVILVVMLLLPKKVASIAGLICTYIGTYYLRLSFFLEWN